MANKTLNTRVVNKHDSATNWVKAVNFIPLQGQIIVYDSDGDRNYERFKIGDGINTVNNLPFYQAQINEQKVDKVEGKGLSTNDYTTEQKNKLAGIDAEANKTIVDTALSSTSINPVQNKAVNSAISSLNNLVGKTSVSSQISSAIANKSDVGHTHDDRYYTENEINTKLSDKLDVATFDDLVGDTAVSTQISNYAAQKTHNHDSVYSSVELVRW